MFCSTMHLRKSPHRYSGQSLTALHRDVRRAVLVSIPPGPDTLPAILTRTRDVDPSVRRAVYHIVLNPDAPNKDEPKSEDDIGETHPRALTIAQRELIVKHGLGDREESVKAAAVKLLTSWMDTVMETPVNDGTEKELSVIAFLRLFDLSQTSVPEDALSSVFGARPDVLDNIEFSRKLLVSWCTPQALIVQRSRFLGKPHSGESLPCASLH